MYVFLFNYIYKYEGDADFNYLSHDSDTNIGQVKGSTKYSFGTAYVNLVFCTYIAIDISHLCIGGIHKYRMELQDLLKTIAC